MTDQTGAEGAVSFGVPKDPAIPASSGWKQPTQITKRIQATQGYTANTKPNQTIINQQIQ